MKFTQVPSDTFQKLQLNAGILASAFTPSTGTLTASNIIGATGGGVSFEAVPNFVDFGDGIDNVPSNTKELKRIQDYSVKMSGTFKMLDLALAKRLAAAGDTNGSAGKLTPSHALSSSDFDTIWWIGDYSDKNGATKGGFIAVELKNALSTGGLKITSADKDKGSFAFEFTAHYSINAPDTVPFNVYVKAGEAEPGFDATLSALTLGSLTLSPTFDKDVTSYTASTTDSTNTVTATPTDNTATVVIKNGSTTVTSGNSATWSAGPNTVTVTVTAAHAEKVYTVTVTKS